MVQKAPSVHAFYAERGTPQLFKPAEVATVDYPIQAVDINWDRLSAKRELVMDTVQAMPAYLVKPEVLYLLDREKNPTYRLIMDLMWSTGARISEVLGLKPESFRDDGYDYGVILSTLKQRPGRPTKRALARSPKRYVPIADVVLQNQIQRYIALGKFRQSDRLFTMTRQTVNRHIKALTDKAGGAPFNISAHTFRHSFAIHLMLHGRPLKYISKLLGHKSIDSTEIYTNILTVDGEHFMRGVDFH
ncbi:MAG: tyrosine-type recombinase/integrase [Pseudohongiella sp.]|nr:tyrosine-type recombinase/integrase [Pseudohongiella sp.]